MKTPTEQMIKENRMTVVTLTAEAVNRYRIPRAERGMTFVVDKFTNGVSGMVAHVRDYRFVENDSSRDYAIWSIEADMYEIAYSVAL